jgi:hypothetical protein
MAHILDQIFQLLKGPLHEIFDLKVFSIWISIRVANRLCIRRFLSQRCQWHRCDVHSGINDNAVTCTAVSMTPLWLPQRCHWHRCANMKIGMCRGINFEKSQRCQWHRCDMHSGVNDTAVQIWHRCDFLRPICEALVTFKGNIYPKNIHRPIVLHHTYNFHT